MTARLCNRLKLLFSLAGLIAGGLASAQQADGLAIGVSEEEEPQRRYSVEIIVFAYAADVSAGTEIFVPEDVPQPPMVDDFGAIPDDSPGAMPGVDSLPSSEPGFGAPADSPAERTIPQYGDTLPDPVDSIIENEELETLIDASSVNLRVLAPEELTLTDVHERLLRLDAYRPVLWAGWEQDVREAALTPAIKLRRLGNIPLDFSGELSLYLGRFLHLVTDVKMMAPPTNIGPQSYRARPPSAFGQDYGFAPDGYPKAPPVYYEIADNRIMKSGDIRYFDHPKFGILARLTRMEDAPQEPVITDLEGPTTDDLAPGTPPR